MLCVVCWSGMSIVDWRLLSGVRCFMLYCLYVVVFVACVYVFDVCYLLFIGSSRFDGGWWLVVGGCCSLFVVWCLLCSVCCGGVGGLLVVCFL